MAKVKYIKLSDALEMLQKRRRDAERHFSETGYPISFINAAAYGEAIKLLGSLSTVEMEVKYDKR